MAEFFEKYVEEMKQIWQKLNKGVQILIVLITIIMAGVFGYLIFRGTSANYQPLFTNLTTDDTAAIVERLDESGSDYQLGGKSGNTILVPESEIHKLRLDMASAGLPDQGVVGFEIFNSSEFGTTEFERRVNYYRALGGEMSRSIQSIFGIEFARVQITPPEESLFIEEEKSATASVMVKLASGYNMNSEQVNAVQNLVASGVQNLPLEDVTIVDTQGNLLSNSSDSDEKWGDPENFALKQQFEKSLKNDLKTLLTKVLGPNNFAVEINANLNFDQRQAESKTYSPVVDESGIVRSEELNSEKQNNGTVGGVPGTDTNIPQYQAEANAENNSYESENKITNYEINERIEKHVYAPGDLKRLSVSVMVDESTDEETVIQIRNAVSAAVGYNEERGDVLNISSIAFDDSLEVAAQNAIAAQKEAADKQLYIYGALILLVLVLTSALIIYLYRKRNSAQTTTDIEKESAVEEEEDIDLFEPDAEQRKNAKVKKELENMIHSDPENAAKLIRSWLIDE